MKKKKIIILISIIVFLFITIIFLLFGFTENLKLVMPKYDTVVYSEANFLQYDYDLIVKAKKEIEKQYSRLKNKKYKDNDYYKKGIREILRLNLMSIENYIKNYDEEEQKKWQELESVSYLDIIHSYNYTKNKRGNDLVLYIDMSTVKEEEMYYTVKGSFYLPSDMREKEMPKATTSNIEEGEQEIKILKDANICYAYGPNFLYVSNVALIDRVRGSDFDTTIKVKDLFKANKDYEENNDNFDSNIEIQKIELSKEEQDSLEQFIKAISTVYMNYICYDEKGYVTDLYYFTK